MKQRVQQFSKLQYSPECYAKQLNTV